jgi:hypothetical protein
MTGYRLFQSGAFALVLGAAGPALAQDIHPHTPSASGVPQGIPYFCANPTVTSVGSGAWSKADTWSSRRVPGPNDKVAIAAGHEVVYDAVSDASLTCVEVNGQLRFSPATSTRMKVRTLMVTDAGFLEIGSAATPVAPDVTAEVVIADQPIDSAIDPAQFGNGIVGLGRVTMHGAAKTPTFVRLKQEPLAGQTKLIFEQVVSGWKAGDRLALPDTRQLRASERGAQYRPQVENLEVASISGAEVTLVAPLKYDHKGARNANGRLRFLPHVGNVSRNVIVRSENPQGTRGHTMFVSHASVDIRYVQFSDLGRTQNGVLSSADFNSDGLPVRVGSNQIGRYALHFHHDFGPKETPANGYQFTVIGNAIDSARKWGITVHRSHFGLVQDNVVYNTGGAGIVTEDGTESFNVFDHNLSMRSAASGRVAMNTGYGAGDPGGEGAGFWFRGPNNVIRNNVAANCDEFGFGLAPAPLGIVRTPAFKGADTSKATESKDLDTRDAAVLEFSNNEAYGAMQAGVAFSWSGTISNFAVWHASRHGVTGTPTDTLTVDRITARGDPSMLADPLEKPVGLWFGDYRAANIVVSNADVEGVRIGVSSPFFYSQTTGATAARRQSGSILIDNGSFRTHIGVTVATAYAVNASAGIPLKKAVVRSTVFEPLKGQATGTDSPETISMNYGIVPGDPEPRDPILVYDYNKQPGKNFKVYYSNQAPRTVAPCHDTVAGIGGWVCELGSGN